MSTIYLIKKAGDKPSWYHEMTPWHPVLMTSRRDAALWLAGYSGEGAWMWSKGIGDRHAGWLLIRWNGLDIDYGHVVRGVRLPDGDERAFDHRHAHPETFALQSGAVWWSPRKMPAWLAAEGVVYPSDRFTQQNVLDFFADDGCSGFGRPIPAHWIEPVRASAKEASG